MGPGRFRDAPRRSTGPPTAHPHGIARPLGRPRSPIRNSQHRRHRVEAGRPIPDGAMASSIGSRPAPTSGSPACCKTSSTPGAMSSTTKAASPSSPPSSAEPCCSPRSAASGPWAFVTRKRGSLPSWAPGSGNTRSTSRIEATGLPSWRTPTSRATTASAGLGAGAPRRNRIPLPQGPGTPAIRTGGPDRSVVPSRAWNADTGTVDVGPRRDGALGLFAAWILRLQARSTSVDYVY